MKNKLIMTVAVAALVGFSASVQATPVTGGISLGGGYTVNTGDINTATSFTGFTGVYVTSTTGSFLAAGVTLFTPGSVSMLPFTFSPFPVVGLTPLWQTIVGPLASFDLNAPISVSQPGDGTLTLKGNGMLSVVGYDAAPGNWVFTANSLGGTFSFSSSNGAIPDGGTTVGLLGLALGVCAVFARKFKHA